MADAGAFKVQALPADFPDAFATDPRRMGWMQGTPPPPDKQVLHARGDHMRFPQSRWAFANYTRFVPSVSLWRGAGPVATLPVALRDDLDAVPFKVAGTGQPMTWGESLAANYTDAIVVLHRGTIVYERYFGVMGPMQQHMAMSVTKSFIGTMAAMAEHAGVLDPDALVADYIPELREAAHGPARVRDVMDMRIGVAYSEEYANPQAGIWEYLRGAGLLPKPADYQGASGFYPFLRGLKQDGPHGDGFYYKTVNSDVLGWLVSRATGRDLIDLWTDWLWSRIGMERDAALLIDPEGAVFAGGGLNPITRDMARFGEVMRLGGHFNGQQIVPQAVVAAIRAGGDPVAFAKGGPPNLQGWSYRHQWWVSNHPRGVFAARGVHGQAIYVDVGAEMVIARFGSHPLAANINFDPTSLPAFDALAEHLMRS